MHAKIFSSNRALRRYYNTQPDGFLPKGYSISSFLNRALNVESRTQASQEVRVLLMQEATNFDSYEKLKIPNNFMAFVKNVSYLFGFFEELASEQKSVDELKNSDTYAEFSEHLDILEQVQKNYFDLLDTHHFYDKINFPALAKLDLEFIEEFEDITLQIDGFLSEFEWSVFYQIASYTTLHVEFETSPYNKKISSKFGSFEPNQKVSVELANKQITTLKNPPHVANITVSPFSIKSLQCGFVFSKIAEFISQKVDPSSIVVILPDESFAPLLKMYDKHNLLNFAMGFDNKNSDFSQKSEAITGFIQENSYQNHKRLQRVGVSVELALMWQSIWYKSFDFVSFSKILKELSSDELEESLLKIKPLFEFKNECEFYKAFYLFKKLYQSQRVDDTRGGPVSVLGVLETRGLEYEAVIIVDFNDDVVPKKSDKDLFLSSKLRSHVDMPTQNDRENLQKSYYHNIIQKSRYCAISYVKNEQNSASRFLQSFEYIQEDFDESIINLLMTGIKQEFKEPLHVEFEHHPYEYPLSASRFKSLLLCKRQYYFKYIKKIQEPTIPSDEPEAYDIGNFVHEALKYAYEGENPLKRVDEFISSYPQKGAIWEFKKEFWRKKLHLHIKKHVDDEYRPFLFEQKISSSFCGVNIEGKIDRLDKNDQGMIRVIDYKSGSSGKSGAKSVEMMSDFQMQFYYLLAQKFGEVGEVAYFLVGQNTSEIEGKMEEKLAKLQERLEANRVIKSFEQCEDVSICNFCSYKFICKRD